MQVSPEDLAQVLAQEQAELIRREQLYRGQHPAASIAGRPIILVDDGLATGATLRAAAIAVRAQHPSRLTVAVPVGSSEGCASLAEVADEVVCPLRPQDFRAVSLWYRHMPQTEDDEVRQLLDRAWSAHARDLRLSSRPRA
jgi:predicted phosphoribosyltransferase